MPRRSQRGNDRENRVAALLREDGWVVGSMRQSAGGGDLIAARRTGRTVEIRLVEVKSTAGGPYERFGPRDRASMLEYATRAGAAAYLAWWPPGHPLKWIASRDWPL